MHLVWWILWIMFLLLIFATPYEIPGNRKLKSPLEILQNRFAGGSITKEEYQERKDILEKDGAD
jgi:putative membrane protein